MTPTNFIAAVILTLLCSFSITHAQSQKLTETYWQQAQAAEQNGRYLDAVQLYEKFIATEKSSKNPRLEELSEALTQAAYCYGIIGELDKSLSRFEESLAIERKLGKGDRISASLNVTALAYYTYDKYDQALTYYGEALAINRKLGKEDEVAVNLGNIGSVYNSWGQYDKALKYFEEALAISKKHGKKGNFAILLSNIGSVHNSWGQYDKALKSFEEALAFARELEKEEQISASLNLIGDVYYSLNQFDKALKYFEEALAINRKLAIELNVAKQLNNIGAVYQTRGQYDETLKYFNEALTVFKKLGQESSVATLLNNIGMVYDSMGQFEKALKHYAESLVIDRKLRQDEQVALRLSNIGATYYELKKYRDAIENLSASVEVKEKLRKTATGTARRDYLASQVGTYQLLINSYQRNNDLANAFKTMEISRAKLLSERLASDVAAPTIPTVTSIQQEMSSETAIIAFANSNRNSVLSTIVLIITKEKIASAELGIKKLMASLKDEHKQSISKLLSNQRGLKAVNKSGETDKKQPDKLATSFDDLINYYRNMLTNPSSGINSNNRGLAVKNKPAVRKNGEDFDRMLYDFLVKPVAQHLKGKKRLIIIPDGVLSYLPFETLKDENNTLLVEKYNFSYTQSMGILNMLKKRTYPSERKPMLAFGGAVYDEVSYGSDMITSEKQLLDLVNNVYSTTRSMGPLGDAYGSLGMAKWDNLPGTLSEVEAIARAVKGTQVITGRDVTENRVKQLSTSGELSKYKVVHFATHGIVVPEIPELSAIVLSQIKNQPAGDDGYLRMDKIEKLKLKADFVNLSACETGLGKIFGGEGVVGLTQSFLLAGANGLSASLWSVNDTSTSQFMVSLYKMVEEKKIGYADAITQVKRDFILGKYGEAYRAPYYWAPFVYYGKL